jgi:hypothetical protein
LLFKIAEISFVLTRCRRQSMTVTMSDGSSLPLEGPALKEALQYR